MKTFINLSVGVYIIAGALLLTLPPDLLPNSYNPRVMSSLAFLSALLVILPRAVFRKPKNESEERVLIKFQLLIASVLLINGAGGLGLYKLYLIGFGYDKLAHFLTSFLLTLWGAVFLRGWFGKNRRGALGATASLVILGGFLWELLEALSDSFLGTSFIGGGDDLMSMDTAGDVLMNFLGAALAIIVLMRKRSSSAL